MKRILTFYPFLMIGLLFQFSMETRAQLPVEGQTYYAIQKISQLAIGKSGENDGAYLYLSDPADSIQMFQVIESTEVPGEFYMVTDNNKEFMRRNGGWDVDFTQDTTGVSADCRWIFTAGGDDTIYIQNAQAAADQYLASDNTTPGSSVYYDKVQNERAVWQMLEPNSVKFPITVSDLTSDGETVPGFHTDSLSYTIELAPGTTEVPTVTASVDDNSEVVVNDAAAIPGATTVVVSNIIGASSKTYTINYFTMADNIATLSGINLEIGSLDQAFDPGTFSYTATVPYGTNDLEVTATTTSDFATVEGEGKVFVHTGSGQAELVVTAYDNTTTETYTVDISYEADEEVATLSDITLHAGLLYPKFDKAQLGYTALIPVDTNIVNVDATPMIAGATVEGGGAIDVSSGTAIDTIKVTATNGVDTKNYILKFIKNTHSYPFEDGTCNDVIGTAHGTRQSGDNDTIINGVYSTLQDGGFIEFSGYELELNTYPEITMEAYVTAGDGTNPSWSMLAYFGGDYGANAYWVSIARGDNVSRTEVNINDGEHHAVGSELDDGKRHHIVSTISADSISLYIDGVLQGRADIGATDLASLDTTANANSLLARGGWPDPSWLGSFHEFNLFSGAMSPEMVAARAKVDADEKYTDVTLSDITLSKGLLVPEFDPDITEYKVLLELGTTSVDVSATPNGYGATVTGGGTITVSELDIVREELVVTSPDESNTGTYTIDFVVADKINNALTITDPSTRVVVDEMADSSNSWTFETWLKLDTIMESYTGILDARGGDYTTSFILKEDNGNQYLSYEYGGDWTCNTTARVPINQWAHVAMVVSAADSATYFYVNGQLMDTDTAYPHLGDTVRLGTADNPGVLRIGNGNDTDSRSILGKMDETRIWTTARTAAEINDNMTMVDPATPGLLVYYNCDAELPTDTVLNDTTGNYDAIIRNANLDFTWELLRFADSSSVATLEMLEPSVGIISPAFNAATTDYTVTVPYASKDDVVSFTWERTNINATVTGASGDSVLNGDGSADIVVTAQDGETEVIYHVEFNVEAPSTDATLSDLAVDGTTIDNFDPATFDYAYVILDVSVTEVPEVTATATDENAEVVITEATELSGATTIEVTAEDGETSQTYTVNFSYTGIENIAFANVKVYPSPVDRTLNISNIGEANIFVYSLEGVLITSVNNTDDMAAIDVSEMKAGLYLLKIQKDENTMVIKFIKK